MSFIKRYLTRVRRALVYAGILLAALIDPARRRLLREILALGRDLPSILDQNLMAALASLTPEPAAEMLDSETIRRLVDAATAYGLGRPLGICLRRSLLRYHFLRRAGLPLVVHFGARRKEDGIGGHAWLMLDGAPYHEPPENYRGFAVMFVYPPESKAE